MFNNFVCLFCLFGAGHAVGVTSSIKVEACLCISGWELVHKYIGLADTHFLGNKCITTHLRIRNKADDFARCLSLRLTWGSPSDGATWRFSSEQQSNWTKSDPAPARPPPPRFCEVQAAFMRQRDFLSGKYGELKKSFVSSMTWGARFQVSSVWKAEN